MTKNRVYRGCLYLILVALLVPFYGCGGGGGSDTSAIVPTTPTADVAGLWIVDETSGANTCGDPVGIQSSYPITVSQTAAVLTVATPAGTFTGSVGGDTISWTGNYPEQSGTTTITSLALTVGASDASLSGSVDWTWTDGVTPCAGTTAVTGIKQVPTSATPVDVAGIWSVTDTLGVNSCGDVGVEIYDISITQVGSDITIVTPAGTFTGTVDGNIMGWTGSHPDAGGTTTMTSMVLIVDAGGMNFSGPVSWNWTDGAYTCSGSSSTTGSK